MKWKILFNGFSPQRKCGAEVALGIGAGIASLAGSLYSNDVASSNVGRQLSAQSGENQLNRDWQTAEAEKARQFNAGQQQTAFGQVGQLQAQQQQYNLQSMGQQAKYNSPVWQREQLEKAGINPQVYFGSHSSFAGSSAQSGGVPSAPSPASSPIPGSVSGLSPVAFQPANLNVTQLASAMRDFAQAKKLGVEADWLPRQLQSEIMNKDSYSNLNKVLQLGAKINNEIQNAKIPYAIKQAAADLAKSVSEAELNVEKKITEKSLQAVNESISKLNGSLEKLNQKEYERYGIFLRYYENQLQEGLNNLRADTSLKSEQANETYWSGEIKAVDAFIRKATKMDDVLARLHDFQAKDIQSQADRYAACEQLAKNIQRSKAYENYNYAKINACIEMLAEKFGIPVAIVAKYFLK